MLLRSRLFIAWLAWASLALALQLPRARALPASLRVPVVLHAIAPDESACQAFVEEQLSRANELFRPLGIELVLASTLSLPVRHAELVTRSDRDALARYTRPGAIHWFVVNKLMDVDEPGRERRGVHWRKRGDARRHFVVVSKISGPYVLAHELGHFFGNPAHSEVAGNLMSYERGEGAPFLEEAQIANVKAALTRMLASHELEPLPGAPLGDAATKD